MPTAEKIANPYLDEFERVIPDWRVPWMDRGSSWIRRTGTVYASRQMCRRLYGFAVPCIEALEEIARHAPILEIGAGTGYWAYLLRQMGVDVLASEPFLAEDGQNAYGFVKTWTNLIDAMHHVAADRPDRALMLCWPPYDEPMAAECLELYRGDTVIYVGEWRGCTADDRFHDMLASSWDRVKEVKIPQWDGLHDFVMVYKRSRKPERMIDL